MARYWVGWCALLVLACTTGALGETADGMLPVQGKVIKHTVLPGEDLWSLARKYDLAMDHIMMANGMTGLAVKPGQKLLIPKMVIPPAVVEDGLIINLPERLIYHFKDGDLVATFPCAVGQGGRFATPTGNFKIVTLQENPTWFPPEWAHIENPVPPGPSNPLGDRWIGLSADGVGMHATNDPMSIGEVISHGCMRMYPWHARELFESVKIGQPARIVYEPVKVGFSTEDHNVYISVFPDIYGVYPNLLDVAREKLDKLGLTPLVDEERLKAIVERRAGMPISILGSDVVVKINNQRVETRVAPIIRNGQVWVTSEVFRACGMRMSFNDRDRLLTLSADNNDVHFSLEPPADPIAPDYTPLRWHGQSILPLAPVLNALNVVHKWDPAHKTFLIYIRQIQARLPMPVK